VAPLKKRVSITGFRGVCGIVSEIGRGRKRATCGVRRATCGGAACRVLVPERGIRERNGATRRSGSEWSEPKRGAGENRGEAAAPSAKNGAGYGDRTRLTGLGSQGITTMLSPHIRRGPFYHAA